MNIHAAPLQDLDANESRTRFPFNLPEIMYLAAEIDVSAKRFWMSPPFELVVEICDLTHRFLFRLLAFAISTTFRGTCTCLTLSVPSSRASTKTSSSFRFIGSEMSSNSFPYSLIFFFFAYP